MPAYAQADAALMSTFTTVMSTGVVAAHAFAPQAVMHCDGAKSPCIPPVVHLAASCGKKLSATPAAEWDSFVDRDA